MTWGATAALTACRVCMNLLPTWMLSVASVYYGGLIPSQARIKHHFYRRNDGLLPRRSNLFELFLCVCLLQRFRGQETV